MRAEHTRLKPFIDWICRGWRQVIVFARFSLSSVLSALLDYAVFYLLYKAGLRVALSIFFARLASVIFNYLVVRNLVFFSRRKATQSFLQYILLVIFSGTMTWLMIRWLAPLLKGDVLMAKIFAESVLFFFNYFVQKTFIFHL